MPADNTAPPSTRKPSSIIRSPLIASTVPSASDVVLPGPRTTKLLPVTLPATVILPPAPWAWITKGTDKVSGGLPAPPIATGLDPPAEPITSAGTPLTLLGSRFKPPALPAPPSEIATPAGGETCKPVPAAANWFKSTALPSVGIAMVTDWITFTVLPTSVLAASVPPPASLIDCSVTLSLTFSTSLLASLTIRSASRVKLAAMMRSFVSPRLIAAPAVAPTRRTTSPWITSSPRPASQVAFSTPLIIWPLLSVITFCVLDLPKGLSWTVSESLARFSESFLSFNSNTALGLVDVLLPRFSTMLSAPPEAVSTSGESDNLAIVSSSSSAVSRTSPSALRLSRSPLPPMPSISKLPPL